MQSRRRVVGLVGSTALLSMSGCLGFISGEEAYEVESQPARVDEATVSETDYEIDDIEEEVVEETFEVAGQEREVVATNYATTYEKTLDHPLLGEVEAGVFALFSTPAVEIAGRTLNPVGDYDNDELVDMLSSNYDELEVREQVETNTYEPLGQSYEASTYDASAEFAGQGVDVYVQVGSFQHEDDFLIPIAIYPQDRAEDEEPVVAKLSENLDHPTER